jgi:CheY-like chemotaxis protein
MTDNEIMQALKSLREGTMHLPYNCSLEKYEKYYGYEDDVRDVCSISFGDLKNMELRELEFVYIDREDLDRDNLESYYIPLHNIFVVPQYMQGSDYGGSLVDAANKKAFLEEYEGTEGGEGILEMYGGHGSFGVAIPLRVYLENDEIQSTLHGLEDYPVVCEETLSQLEMEGAEEAWESWVEGDFVSAVEGRLGIEDLEEDEEKTEEARRFYQQQQQLIYLDSHDPEKFGWEVIKNIRELFEVARERAGEEWFNEGQDMTIRVEEVAKEVTLTDLQQSTLSFQYDEDFWDELQSRLEATR